jgi:hypothetical protein
MSSQESCAQAAKGGDDSEGTVDGDGCTGASGERYSYGERLADEQHCSF